MNIYIACALTHVPRNHFEEYTAFIHAIAKHLRENEGQNVKYALVDSDPQLSPKPSAERAKLCYLWDSKMVQESDLVIAECSFPSVGLGMELQMAVEKDIPVILVFKDFHENRMAPVRYQNPDQTEHDLQIGDGYVSLMALGAPVVYRVHQYDQANDGVKQICESVALLER